MPRSREAASNNRGFIPNTSGAINRPAGQYEICFYERLAGGAHRSGTYPVFFTITWRG